MESAQSPVGLQLPLPLVGSPGLREQKPGRVVPEGAPLDILRGVKLTVARVRKNVKDGTPGERAVRVF